MNWADREYCIGRGLAALTSDPDVCVPEYVYHFVDTQTQEMLALSAGSTFPNLPGEKLKTLPIPLPSVPEQRRIVSYLDSLQTKVHALKQLQAETITELDAMLPSILDRAFKGDLL
jgi:type I restriction enzyme S subunit